MSTLKPMDTYSYFMDTPFDVAAYCRSHKFSVEAVDLARAIASRRKAQLRIDAADRDMAVALRNMTTQWRNAAGICARNQHDYELRSMRRVPARGRI